MGIMIGVELPEHPQSWAVVHGDDDALWADGLADWAAAESVVTQHDDRCRRQDCACTGARVVALFGSEFDTAPTVQISASNARHLADLLGLGPDIWDVPALDPDDLMGRVLIAQAISPIDAGVPATAAGQVIDCGRRPGWAQERLAQLHDVAAAAKQLGVRVMWA